MTPRPSLMLEADAINPLRGKACARAFLARHWQRRPAVVRQATDRLPADIDRDTLFSLARQDEVESRLIARRGRRYRLTCGPHDDASLPPPGRRQWTLLVQGVDRHLDSACELLHRFRFVPSVRIDDLMVSIAGDGGGVGAHQDSYDVFLLQLSGRRHWTLGRPGRYDLAPGQPLRLIERYEACASVELVAGDMLYLPPGWVHDGVARGECITASIGFRVPGRAELLSAWLQDCAERFDREREPDRPSVYRDRPGAREARAWTAAPGRLPAAMRDSLRHWLRDWQASDTGMNTFIGRYLTEPAQGVWFERPSLARCRRFERDVKRSGVRLDRRSRISYFRAELFLNGEVFALPRSCRAAFRQLADARQLQAAQCDRLWERGGDLLAALHAAGWLHVRKG